MGCDLFTFSWWKTCQKNPANYPPSKLEHGSKINGPILMNQYINDASYCWTKSDKLNLCNKIGGQMRHVQKSGTFPLPFKYELFSLAYMGMNKIYMWIQIFALQSKSGIIKINIEEQSQCLIRIISVLRKMHRRALNWRITKFLRQYFRTVQRSTIGPISFRSN